MEDINEKTMSNREKAIIEADKIDNQIIETLKLGKNFRVEAGAGSGKTYSLNKVVDWLQNNNWKEYKARQQQIICITYTNAAVNVIESRLKPSSSIIPSTIHSFAWQSMKQFQSTLVELVKENNLIPPEVEAGIIKRVQYTLGVRYVEHNVLFLHHSDVITLFSLILDKQKFRAIFSQKYPIILIDEYQDSFSSIMDKFLQYFITKGIGPQFGLFGDAWQTIYQSNKACGLVEDENLFEIKKVSNFRSAPKIVDLLNKLRPDLPQISAIDDFEGEILVVTSNDYKGVRRSDRNFNGDLPASELENRLQRLQEYINLKNPTGDESTKILMITHRVLAVQQGYDNLLNLLGDHLRDEDDEFLLFFMNIVEPVFEALVNQDMNSLFDALGINRYPIVSKSQKTKWLNLRNELENARKLNTKSVLDTVINSGLIPVPPKIEEYYKTILKESTKEYQNGTLEELCSISYSEFISVIAFIRPNAIFSTDHGVKGEEYDNVIFVIGRGWNNYQFETYMPMDYSQLPSDKVNSYIRNRNLFYVCCSRPKKRLILFISVEVQQDFDQYLKDIFGYQNVITYTELITG